MRVEIYKYRTRKPELSGRQLVFRKENKNFFTGCLFDYHMFINQVDSIRKTGSGRQVAWESKILEGRM